MVRPWTLHHIRPSHPQRPLRPRAPACGLVTVRHGADEVSPPFFIPTRCSASSSDRFQCPHKKNALRNTKGTEALCELSCNDVRIARLDVQVANAILSFGWKHTCTTPLPKTAACGLPLRALICDRVRFEPSQGAPRCDPKNLLGPMIKRLRLA